MKRLAQSRVARSAPQFVPSFLMTRRPSILPRLYSCFSLTEDVNPCGHYACHPRAFRSDSGFCRLQSSLSSVSKRRSSLSIGITKHDDLVDEEEQFRWTKTTFRWKQIILPDLNAISTRRSVFDDPNLAPHHWAKKDYENFHRFHPTARWTYSEEKVSHLYICRDSKWGRSCHAGERPLLARSIGRLC